MIIKLEKPSERRKASYLSLVQEFREKGEPFIPFILGFPTDVFSAFLEKMEDCAKGIGMTKDYVPHETFWLVADDSEVVAVSNLRHHLTESSRKDGGHIGYGVRPSARRKGYATNILAETLKKANQRGITKALVTCHKSNQGSVKTILKNGGVLDSVEFMEDHNEIMQRYWINITESNSNEKT